MLEELDYEYEAQNQRAFARGYRGHPFIHVPDVVTRLSTGRVLVSEWVDGAGFDDVKELPQAERDRFAEIVFRFCFGSIYHLQHFNADAHPGNYILMEDGKVAFLDFGMTKQLDKEQIELEIAALEAVFDEDPERLRVALHDLGFLNKPRKVDAEKLMAHVMTVGGWYMEDRDVTIDSQLVMDAISAVSDPRSEFFDLMRRENVPANELMGRRMEVGVMAVLGQLTATRNWYAHRPRVVVRRRAGHGARATGAGLLRVAWRARGREFSAGLARCPLSQKKLVLALEDLRHRVVGEDLANRLREDVGHGERADQLGRARAERHGVGHDDARQR